MGCFVILVALCCHCAAQELGRAAPSYMMNESEVMDWSWKTLMKLYNNSFPGSEPSGSYYDAALEITKATARAHAAAQRSPDAGVDVAKLTKFLQLASGSKNKELARSTLARTLYGFFMQYLGEPGGRKSLKIDTITFAAAQFLETVKETIGVKVFDNLVARKGGKTLAFAVDTTGSMTDDIKAARAIAKAIVTEKRQEKVDYILSPFSDPTYGPVIYKTEEQGGEFVDILDSIKPRGGGDCQELTFTGILEALNAGPQYGSPLFVITDASAKDDTGANMKTAKVIAQSTGITINFFTKEKSCDKDGLKSYRDLAAFTSGQVFPLKSDQELKNLTEFVRDSLDTTQIISMSRTFAFKRRGSRSIYSHHYPLHIDEFVEKLRVTVTTKRESKGLITLLNPNKTIQSPSMELTRTTVYGIRKPMPGKWTLKVEKVAGNFDFVARVKSTKIIQFGYYFVLTHNGIISPISYPLSDKLATIYVTIGGSHHTAVFTLSIRLIDDQGRTLQKGIKLTPLGKTGVHFKASFMPPSKTRFKIVLTGRTKTGIKFTRVSQYEVVAKTVLMVTLYGQGVFTVTPGKRSMLVIGLHNSGMTEFFKIKSFSEFGDTTSLRSRVIARHGRMGFATLVFVPKMRASHGSTVTLFLVAKGERTGRLVSKTVKLLVVKPSKLGNYLGI